MNKKKLLTSVVALGTAAVLALGGTFAWQSINQTALNESSDDVNPGGRLHDDFDGSNKDVYVENFAEENIFARIRLTEYFEVVMNYGGEAETVDTVIGTRGAEVTDDTGTHYDRNGTVFSFDGRVNEDNGTVNAGKDPAVTDSDYYWWTWTMGSADSEAAYYMPTFNLNKDSLAADVNGQYKTPGVITSQDIGQYTGYTEYAADSTEEGTEIFDADRNAVDEVGNDFSETHLQECVDAGNITLYTEDEDGDPITHTAKAIGTTKGLISMSDWLTLLGDGTYSAETHGGYWVYDTDGWVYWSSPIAPDSTTGRLLDGIKMNHVMDDSWYYKLTVEGQFVTADDVGKDNNTGFYQDAGEAPTENAEKLLGAIGVVLGDSDSGTSDDDAGTPDDSGTADTTTLTLLKGGGSTIEVQTGSKVTILVDGIDNLLEGYSTTNSARSLFKVAETALGEPGVQDNTESFGGDGWTMELNYDSGTVTFIPGWPLDSNSGLITYTDQDGATYMGSVTAKAASLPTTGGNTGE